MLERFVSVEHNHFYQLDTEFQSADENWCYVIQ